MRSRVNTTLVVNSREERYPYQVDILAFDLKTRKLLKSWCAINVVDSTYREKVLERHGIIGEDRILPRFLGLKLIPCNYE